MSDSPTVTTIGELQVEDWHRECYLDGVAAQFCIKRGGVNAAFVFEAEDARLMAAAPELLRCLVELLDSLPARGMWGPYIDDSEAVIRLAGGEA